VCVREARAMTKKYGATMLVGATLATLLLILLPVTQGNAASPVRSVTVGDVQLDFASVSPHGNGTCMVPPHPDLLRRMMATGQLQALAARLKLARVRGFETGERTTRKVSGTMKAIVILVDFEDNEASRPRQEFIDMLDSVGGVWPTGSMRDFYLENSYGTFDFGANVGDAPSDKQGATAGWYRAPQTYEYYVNDQYGLGSFPQNAQGLARDAVEAADDEIDFSNYDYDHDGVVDAYAVVHAGPDAAVTGDSGDIWSHKSSIPGGYTTDDGVVVSNYVITPEWSSGEGDPSTIGVYCHEFGHTFGLPDLYDIDYSSAGLGNWALMSGGIYGGDGTGAVPQHFCAWSKKELGWIPLNRPSTNLMSESIPRVEDNPVAYKLYKEGQDNPEYFLVENREAAVGELRFDLQLIEPGLLIYHVDENMRRTDNTDNADEVHRLITLEQADGRGDLENAAWPGWDDGDPFPGSTGNRNFTESTHPNSKTYANEDVLVRVKNISDAADTMTADLYVKIPIASDLQVSGADVAPTEAGTSQIVALGALELTPVDGEATITHLKVDMKGTATATDVPAIILATDAKADGIYESGVDTDIAQVAPAGGVADFTGLSVNVKSSYAPYHLLIAAQIAPDTEATIGATVGVELPDASYIDAAPVPITLTSPLSSGLATIVDKTPPAPVTDLTVTDVPGDLGGALALDWTAYQAPADVDHYEVYRSAAAFSNINDEGVERITDAVSGKQYTDTDDPSLAGTALYYAVVAVDASGNFDPNVQSVSGTSYANFVNSFGSGLQMVAVPGKPVDPDAAAVFGLDVADIESGDAGIWHWDPAGGQDGQGAYLSYRNESDRSLLQVQPGCGYWVKFPADTDVDVPGTMLTDTDFVADQQGNKYLVLQLAKGWNQIGNPANNPLNWENAKVGLNNDPNQAVDLETAAKRRWVRSYGWIYLDTATGYQLLEARISGLTQWPDWAGAWLRALTNCYLFLPPTQAPPAPSPSALPKRAAGDSEWRLQLVAQAGEMQDSANFVGVSAASRGGDDALLVEAPPQPSPGVDLYITKPGSAIRYAADIRATPSNALSWNVVVECDVPNTVVVVSAPDQREVPRSSQIVLEDMDAGKTCYLRTSPAYTFNSGSNPAPRHFRLRIESGATGALVVSDLTAMATRGGEVEVSFRLSKAAAVRVEVLNIAGRVIRVLDAQASRSVGRNTVTWDGRGALGTRVPNGLYLLRVSASAEDGQSAQGVRTIKLLQ